MCVQTTLWSIRPCSQCGRGVKIEPGYPLEQTTIVCMACVQAAAAAITPETTPTTA